MRFRVLGGMETEGFDGPGAPTAPKQRQVLALLLVNADHVVQTSTVLRELWGDHPPESANTTIQTYIYHLRKWLGSGHAGSIVTRPGGYLLKVDREDIDVHRFERIVREGRVLLVRDPNRAAALTDEALRLWKGSVFADVPCGPVLECQVARLEELRMSAVELGIDAGLRTGRHREKVGELIPLVRSYPYNELLHGQLMRALSMCGRRHEALEVYSGLRRVLRDDLGLEPSAELRELQRRILEGDQGPLETWDDAQGAA